MHGRLHPATWFFIALALLGCIGPAVTFVDGYRTLMFGAESRRWQNVQPSWSAVLGGTISGVFDALQWLGIAAIVEFLRRIWRAIEALRASD